MTDEQWIKQNGRMTLKERNRRGLCWQCGGNRFLYSVWRGQRLTVPCKPCDSTGKASR